MNLHPHLTALVLFTSLTSFATTADASALARCAGPGNAEAKIAACTQASLATPYPWILRWVHRELALAHRERGDVRSALASYSRSLAAGAREDVRREMEQLYTEFTQ